MTVAGLLLDLDDTLYAYAPANEAGRAALFAAIAKDAGVPLESVSSSFELARRSTKARTRGTGASHGRLLYLSELVHAMGRPDLLGRIQAWEALYWETYLDAAVLDPRAHHVLTVLRRRGVRVCITTNLTLSIQLRKLERLGLLPLIDAVATSEEAGADKPDPRIVELGAQRIGVPLGACVVAGDDIDCDAEVAARLGIPFIHVTGDVRVLLTVLEGTPGEP